jgi:hypothetical protein
MKNYDNRLEEAIYKKINIIHPRIIINWSLEMFKNCKFLTLEGTYEGIKDFNFEFLYQIRELYCQYSNLTLYHIFDPIGQNSYYMKSVALGLIN